MTDKKLLDSKSYEKNGKVEVLTDKIETLPILSETAKTDNIETLPIQSEIAKTGEIEPLPIQSEARNFKPKNKERKFLRFGFVVIILAIAFGSIRFWQNQQNFPEPISETPLPNILSVPAIPIKLVNSYSVAQSYTGIVEAKRTSELGFERSGLLRSIYIEEGDTVTKGQIIAELDTSQTIAQRGILIAQREKAIASLKELQNGARIEEIAAIRASLAQEQARLEELQTGPRIETIAATRASLAQEQAKLEELQTGPRIETIAATRASLAQEQAKLEELQTGTRTEDIEAARLALLDLEEQLELAQIQEKRREELYQQGAISKEQLDEFATQTDTINARLEGARSELEKLQTGTRSEQIEAQRARVRQVQSQLDELIAGTRSEQIEAQKARVRQVQSQLDELIAGTRIEQIEAQRAEVKRFDAEIWEIEVVLRKSILYAPFTGTVSVRNLDEGVVVNAGEAVVRLVEGGERKVRVGVPPTQVSGLRVGSVEEVRMGDKTYSAKVLSILPELDSTTRTQSVILALSQAIAPGTVVRLEVNKTYSMTGYWLPTSALVWGKRGLLACFALVSPEKSDWDLPLGTYQIEKRMVEVLHTEGNRSLVRGVLQPGDLVVTTGTNQLAPGQLVRYLDSKIDK
ncbi:HlyD family efflux transporter periplasmic adaptor subunit [Okeania sp.]|uniref:efflux RND transporter periplasmic adaptor subunit n=1 Tax=Okeania sp. TaxID=3100323 RepID=UPI002B4B7E05|nr:HlyD family efflux transporter periplasmic adaptor subunit [Okeania sp.]MEB3341092.1 HlyD family efflux transporter periplasmic adaptor subunit [Okeania sp.]